MQEKNRDKWEKLTYDSNSEIDYRYLACIFLSYCENIINIRRENRFSCALLEPFMPETADKILAQLGARKRSLEVMNMFGLYQSGNKVTDKPEILFARLDVKEVLEKVEAKKAADAA